MPHRNRVTPLGELVADEARGLVYGNRGCLHDAGGEIVRFAATRRWIACRLEFKGRRRRLLQPGRYTELFFLDEATAFAAGHRPCAECRRADYELLRARWGGADAIDARLAAERMAGGTRRLHRTGRAPDGALRAPRRRAPPGARRHAAALVARPATAARSRDRAAPAHAHPAVAGRAARRRLVRRRAAASSQRRIAALTSAAVPVFKAAYLIHGDDHGRIGERRSRLRAVAERRERQRGRRGVRERDLDPGARGQALNAMTFAVGRRFVIADGVERWKDAELEPVSPRCKAIDPDSAHRHLLRARGRARQGAGAAGQGGRPPPAASSRTSPPSRAGTCPAGCADRARELQLSLDDQAARALIARVGDRQQRLSRELEKIALELGPGRHADRRRDRRLPPAPPSARPGRSGTRSWPATAGGDAAPGRAARPGRAGPALLCAMVRRVRDAHGVAVRAGARGEPDADQGPHADAAVRRRPPDRGRAGATTRRRYRRALELLADLELETRGGGGAALNEDTSAVRVVQAIGSR